MRAFFQLFFGLLLTLSTLFIVAAIIYFRIEYDFTKSLRLGVLSGFFLAIIVSFFIALFLILMRGGKQPQKSILRRKKRSRKIKTISDSKNNKTLEQKIILLMDKELALEVLYHAIHHQRMSILTQSQNKEKTMSIVIEDEIELSINKLTRHTSQLIITSNEESRDIKEIITYMKIRELSFLQY